MRSEAVTLADQGYGARATAIAIIGLEEFAKAIAFAVMATSPERDDADLVEKVRHLNCHEVKHLVAACAEGAQIETADWAISIHDETGSLPSGIARVAAMFTQMAKRGLTRLIEEPHEARKYYKVFSAS